MQTVIGVRFKKAGKVYDFGPGHLEIQKGDHVIVETARGVECGEVVTGPREVEDREVILPLHVVHRIATAEDLQRVADNRAREKDAFAIGVQKIAAHHLPMKLVNVEFTFDGNKIVFYFTADGRIDFRELVKDLASVFRTRIELRQIGVRDEAKLMGGIGCCGRPLCCATFLGEFAPVSIRMAKEQNLSLNPTKISGICGRLMCCLKYENDGYCNGTCCGAMKKPVAQEPTPGSIVATMGGDGKVISVNAQRHTATILLQNGRTVVSSWEDIVERDPEDLAAEKTEGMEDEVLEQTAGGAEDVEATLHRPRRERYDRSDRSRRTDRQGRPYEKRGARDTQEGDRSRRRPPRRPREKGERREWRENREGRENIPQDAKNRRPRRPRPQKPRDRRPKDAQTGEQGTRGEKNE